MAPDDMAPDDMAPDDMAPDDMAPDDIAPDDLAADDVADSAGEVVAFEPPQPESAAEAKSIAASPRCVNVRMKKPLAEDEAAPDTRA